MKPDRILLPSVPGQRDISIRATRLVMAIMAVMIWLIIAANRWLVVATRL